MQKLSKFLLAVGLYFFACSQSHGQDLKIGEPFPGYTSKYGLQTDSALFVGNFKKPLTILWFWNYHCHTNIETLTKLEALQKKYKSQLEIILINIETQAESRTFFKENQQIKLPPFKIICQGRDLIKKFSNKNYQFAVWINNQGLIKHITEHYNLTNEHVTEYLKGNTGAINNLDEGDAIDPPPIFGSSLGHCSINSVSSESRINKNGVFLIADYGSSIAELYRKAFAGDQRDAFKTDAQIIVDPAIANSVLYPQDPNLIDEWKQKHRYYYELKIPTKQEAVWPHYMQVDLSRYFGYTTKVEKRQLECFVLERTGRITPSITTSIIKDGLTTKKYLKDSLACITNTAFADFSRFLKYKIELKKQHPFVDKTGFSGNIDLCIRSASLEPLNIENLNWDLRKYNLKISIKKQPVDVLLINAKK
jgi:thiol-disulfide isomerase/thioredoxin